MEVLVEELRQLAKAVGISVTEILTYRVPNPGEGGIEQCSVCCMYSGGGGFEV